MQRASDGRKPAAHGASLIRDPVGQGAFELSYGWAEQHEFDGERHEAQGQASVNARRDGSEASETKDQGEAAHERRHARDLRDAHGAADPLGEHVRVGLPAR